MRANTMYDHASPLNIDDVLAAFPTLSQTQGAETTSDKYVDIPSIEVIRGLADNGFALHSVTVSRVRKPERRDFEKHMLRFRKRDGIVTADGAPEAVLTNSHDGSSSWALMSGYIRFICGNGLILGSMLKTVRVRHVGSNTLGKVIDGTYTVLNNLDNVADRVAAYQARQLTADEVRHFVETAQRIRLGDAFDKRAADNRLPMIDYARRHDDASNDLWSVFNRVQENIMRPARGSRLRTISGIDNGIKINRQLFDAADALLAA